MRKKRLYMTITGIAGIPAAFILLFFIISMAADYRPDNVETVLEYAGDIQSRIMPERDADKTDSLLPASNGRANAAHALPDTVRILTWNIGYAGLGKNMDFFYDGGKKVRDSKENTIKNLEAIASFIKSADADIILLQEIDISSKRSHKINELEFIMDSLPRHHAFFACNYKTFFVPIPLKEPMGKVHSGIAVLSKCLPAKAARYQYPSSFPFPASMFNLKRCLLACTYISPEGKEIIICNTHNTAFDTGEMRKKETEFLGSMIAEWSMDGRGIIIGGDWNQYPDGYEPSSDETGNPYFSIAALDYECMQEYGKTFYGRECKTLRYLYAPLDSSTTRTISDFFFVSDGISVISTQAIDLGFENSDHNPVITVVAI